MSHTILFLPANLTLSVPAGQTILQAALQQGYHFPWGCNAGSCRVCAGHLRQGRIRLKNSDCEITPDCPEAQAVLTCLAYPLTDITIEVSRVQPPGQFPVQTVSAQIIEVQQASQDVKVVRFLLPAGRKIRYSAGQYCELLIDDNTSAAFSIACAPRDDRILELHIRANPDSSSYPKLAPQLVAGELLKIRLGMGDITPFSLNGADKILLLAGSTGFSQIKALIEALIDEQDPRPLHVYWGGRVAADLYLHEWMQQMARQHPTLHYVPVISDQPDWQGRKGFVHKAALEDIRDFSGWKIVGGGSPGMVYAALDDFIAAGMQADQMVSDVFAYAPR